MREKIKNTSGGLLSGALALSFSAIIVKIFGVIYKVPLSYILTDEGMGYFNSAYTVYAFFYILCTAGVPKAVTVLVTEAEERGTTADRERVYKICLYAFFLIGAVITALFLVFSPQLSAVVGNSKSKASMLAIAPSILFVSLSGVIRGYHCGRSRLLPVAISQVIEAAGKLVLGLLFALAATHLGYSVPMVSAFSVLGITIGSLFSCVYLYFTAKTEKTSKKTGQNMLLDKKSILKRFLKIAIPVSVSSSILSLSGIIDLALIMRGLSGMGFSEEEASALYGNYTTLSVPMMNLVVSILTPISVAALPIFARANLSGKDDEFSSELRTSAKITAIISLPAAASFFLYGYSILDILFLSSASVSAYSSLCALAPSVVFLPLLTLINTALEGKGSFRIPVISLIIGSLLKILLSAFFMKVSGLGVMAAPISTSISYFVSLVYSMLMLARKGTVVSIFYPYFVSFIRVAFSFCLPYAMFFLLDLVPLSSMSSYFSLLLSFVIYVFLSIHDVIKEFRHTFKIKNNC